MSEADVRLAGKNEHPDTEVNKAVQAALLTRQKVIDVMGARARIKGTVAANKKKAAIDNTVLEMVPDADNESI